MVKQLDLQSTIANDVFYLNDLTATLNAQDFINAHGQVKLQKPYNYAGAARVNLADLSIFELLWGTAEHKTPLAGSLVVNWNGEGTAESFQNRGALDLRLEHGRYAELQNLQAKVEAHYTPEQLHVPIIYLGSDKLSLQAIFQAKGSAGVDQDRNRPREPNTPAAYASMPFTWQLWRAEAIGSA